MLSTCSCPCSGLLNWRGEGRKIGTEDEKMEEEMMEDTENGKIKRKGNDGT